MNEEAQDITGAPPVEQGPFSPAPATGRRVTVLQVLPALGGGGVERGTVEIARAIVEAGGRSLVASAGGLLIHDLARAKAEHFELPVDSKIGRASWWARV